MGTNIKVKIEKDLLQSLYYGNNYTMDDISKLFNCSRTTIYNKLKEYNISTKSIKIIQKEISDSIKEKNRKKLNWYINCTWCNKKFHKKPSHIKKNNFCCNNCQNEWMKINFRYENGTGWLGGKTLEKYGRGFNKQLKEYIKKRDNNTCQECAITKINAILNCHHIDYDKKNNSPNNLILLCSSCHMKTNWNREKWTKYYKKRICNAKQNDFESIEKIGKKQAEKIWKIFHT